MIPLLCQLSYAATCISGEKYKDVALMSSRKTSWNALAVGLKAIDNDSGIRYTEVVDNAA